MNIPHDHEKQYESTKNFLQKKTAELNKQIKVFKGSILLVAMSVWAMIVVGGIYYLIFLFSLFVFGTVYSKVAKMKKGVKEPKEMVQKYDDVIALLEQFESENQNEVNDFCMNNLFEYAIKANEIVTCEDLKEKLKEIKKLDVVEKN